jgi:hypothetical protein
MFLWHFMAVSDPMIGWTYPAESCVFVQRTGLFSGISKLYNCGVTKINVL